MLSYPRNTPDGSSLNTLSLTVYCLNAFVVKNLFRKLPLPILIHISFPTTVTGLNVIWRVKYVYSRPSATITHVLTTWTPRRCVSHIIIIWLVSFSTWTNITPYALLLYFIILFLHSTLHSIEIALSPRGTFLTFECLYNIHVRVRIYACICSRPIEFLLLLKKTLSARTHSKRAYTDDTTWIRDIREKKRLSNSWVPYEIFLVYLYIIVTK